jgi:hypothetical protein
MAKIISALVAVLTLVLGGSLGWIVPALAQPRPSAPPPANVPADPWPRQVKVTHATLVVYQPQVESWEGNTLKFRSAVAVRPTGAKDETFGVIWATVRTQVDKISHMVALEDFTVTKSNFPTLPDQGASYISALQSKMAPAERTIALDRLQASLAASGAVKPATFPVNNDPPRVIVSQTPAILLAIDGAPVLQPVPGTRFERVINTRALILREQGESTYYLHVYNGWLFSGTLGGSWFQPFVFPPGIDQVAANLARSGTVDMLDGGQVKPPPLLADGVPTIYVSETPAELIVFKGEPAFTTIAGTTLNWATNTHADVILDTTGNVFYVLLSGRWYRAPAVTGPWAYAPSSSLPADFARIPPDSPAGVVLAAVAGTPQAQEAVIANSIPQTATVPRVNGPVFTPVFDGGPQLSPIEGTPLQYVVNSPTPVIEVNSYTYYALRAGVWYWAAALNQPWTVAASVPPVIYSIPPTSPLHYVTYVQVYGSTAQVVYVGYTPGYMGTVVAPDGVVVYGTGYSYQPWVGTAWYPPPATYGVAAQPVYNPAAGMAFGFAMGVTTAALVGSSSSNYHPSYYGYPCCASTSYNTYGRYGRTYTQGTRSYYANSSSVGESSSGDYTNYRTGTSGSYTTNRSYDPSTGNAQQGYTRGFATTGGTTGNVAREETYNASTGRYAYSSNVSATGKGGSSVSSTVTEGENTDGGTGAQRQTTTTNAQTGVTKTTTKSGSTGPQGAEGSKQTTYTDSKTGATATTTKGTGTGRQVSYSNPTTGKSGSYSAPKEANNAYADRDGNVYKPSSSGRGWQQHSSSGWQSASGDNSWADKEQQARGQGESRYNSYAQSGASRWGGSSSGGWGDRSSGGGGGWGGRASSGWGRSSGGHAGGGWGDRYGESGGGGRFGGYRR